jgi:tetratricopeptide (TPR) repeat protein
MIQLVGLTTGAAPFPPEEVLRSYKEATRIDPEWAEAYEEIGYYYDVVADDPQQAVPAFRKAIALWAGLTAYLGLARALAELGEVQAALQVLDDCPDREDPHLRELREEILERQWG